MAVKTLTLTKIQHPFDRRDRVVSLYEYCGAPLSVIRETLPADLEFAISVNGHVVPDQELAHVVPVPGDFIVFCPVLTGGDNNGKSFGRVIGMLAVAVLSMYTAGAAGEAIGPMYGMSAAQVGMMAGAAVSIIGGVLVGAIFAPKSSAMPALGATSNAYSWTPRTLQQQGTPLPKWYGRNRLTGNIISTYTDADGSKQYINALISLGMGPLAIVDVANVKLNDQPYTAFLTPDGAAAVEPEVRRGDLNQEPVTGFDAIKVETSLQTQVDNASPYVYTAADSSYDSLEIELSFPGGLFDMVPKTGELLALTVQVAIEVSPIGQNQWTQLTHYRGSNTVARKGRWAVGQQIGQNLWIGATHYESVDPLAHREGDFYTAPNNIGNGNWHWFPVTTDPSTSYFEVTAASTQPLRQVFYTDPLPRGQYDIRIIRLTRDDTSWTQTIRRSTLQLSSVREVSHSTLTYPRQALVGLKALAISALSGSLNFSIEADCSLVRVWDGNSWEVAYNNSPAWVLWDVLTQPVFDNDLNVLRYDGIDPSRLDLPKFLELAQWNARLVSDGKGGLEPAQTFNGGFDSETPLWDCAWQVCQVAGCSIIPTGSGYTLAIEKPSDPVQLFTVGNIGPGSFKETFLSMADRAAEISVDFIDRDQNYNRTQVSFVNPRIKTVANKVSVQAPGVNKASEAWRLASRQLAVNELITRTVEFTADIDAIASTVGDVINLQHDVPQWGFGGRLVAATETTVQLDQEVTLEVGTSYSILVRLSDDTLVTRQVSTGPGTTDLLTVVTAFETVPEQYDLYAFGETGQETKPFRVASIRRSSELQASIVAVEYNESIYEVDAGGAAVPTVNYSALAAYVTVANLLVTEYVQINEGGTLARRLLVQWNLSGAAALRCEIYIREQGLPWQQAGTTPDSSFSIPGIRAATTYDVMVVGVNTAGQATPYGNSPTASITTMTTSDAIGSISTIEITGLRVEGTGEFTGRDCSIIWDVPVATAVINHYLVEILHGDTVVRSETVSFPGYTYTFGKNFDDGTGTPAAAFAVRVSAVDIGGTSSPAVVLEVANGVPDAPQALSATGQLMSIKLDIGYLEPDDFDCLEVWSSLTNNRAAAGFVPIGTTKTGGFLHSGLAASSTHYYWARVRDLFGQAGPWYPASATGGVVGLVLSDPTEMIRLLNRNVDPTALTRYLSGSLPFSDLVDTVALAGGADVGQPGVFSSKTQVILLASEQASSALIAIDAANAAIQLKASQESVDALTGEVTSKAAQVDLDAALAEIELRATKGELSGQVDVLSDAIGLKLNATGTVGPGMLISWTDDSHTKSQILFQSDSFLISLPDGTGAKPAFIVGDINGVTSVGVSGDLFVDGSILARHIAADQLVVGDNVTMGPNAVIQWANLSLESKTNLTGAPGTNGVDGLSVFVTYHDNPLTSTPAAPTGNGTSGGWHTTPTAAVIWMSQKVASGASVGTWGAPIPIKGAPGLQGIQGIQGIQGPTPDMTDYLDKSTWLTQVGSDYLFTGKISVDNLVGNTITGKTIQTKADPGTGDRSRFIVSSENNRAEFYDSTGTIVGSLGSTVVIGNGSPAVLQLRQIGTGYAAYITCSGGGSGLIAHGYSGSLAGGFAGHDGGKGLDVSSDTGIGLSAHGGYAAIVAGTDFSTPIGAILQGTASPLMLIPSNTNGPPTTSTAGVGALWVDSSGVLYIHAAVGWQKVSAQ